MQNMLCNEKQVRFFFLCVYLFKLMQLSINIQIVAIRLACDYYKE